MKKYKKFPYKKKLQNGGFLEYLKKNPVEVGQIGGVAGSLVGTVAGGTAEGATLSGALSGAGAGAAFGPVGMGVGAVVGGGLSLLQQKKQQEAEKELERQQKQAEVLAHKDWSRSILKNYATEGVTGTNYYKKGGKIKGDYEVEKNEVVQGYDTRLEAGSNLASDLDLVGGNTHEQGGTEGIGGERVFSDHLTTNGKTFADVAKKLGRSKGKLEKKYETKNTAANNTADRMIGRIEEDLDNLFVEQENMKAKSYVNAARKMQYGGYPPKKNPLYKSKLDQIIRPDIAIPEPQVAASTVNPAVAPEMKAGVVSEFGKYASRAMQGTSALAPFLDNVTNALLKTPAIPKPVRQGQVRLNSNVDVNPELKAIDDAQRNFNLGVDRTTSSNAVARSNKASAFARTLDAKGNIYRTKRAEENAIKNQETAMNAQINAQNNALENDYQMKQAMRQDDVNRRTSQNIAELSQNIQGISRDKKMDEMDIMRTKMTAESNPEVFVSTLSRNPELLDGLYSADELEKKLPLVKGTANEEKLKKIIEAKRQKKS